MDKIGLKIGDILIFFLALIILLASYYSINSGFGRPVPNKNLTLKISAPGGEWIYPLDKKLEIGVEGPLGTTIVNIDNGKAWISESPCTNKICIAAGVISTYNSWVACLPNKVLISISGSNSENEVDNVSF